jgi:hypothetical protein
MIFVPFVEQRVERRSPATVAIIAAGNRVVDAQWLVQDGAAGPAMERRYNEIKTVGPLANDLAMAKRGTS